MRIWIINHYAVSPDAAGGTRHFNFARRLLQKGHEVLIIAADYNHFSQKYTAPGRETSGPDISSGVPFCWVSVPPYKGNTAARFWNMLVFAWRVRNMAVSSALPKPDVIIGSSPHLFAAWGAERLSKRLDVPFVLEVRDIWPDTLVDLGKFTHRHPLIRVMKSIEKHLYRRAKKIIMLLPSAGEYLARFGVRSDDTLWLPNYVDMGLVSGSNAASHNKKFMVMYAGAHGLANDLDSVLVAAEILQQQGLSEHIRICLIGDGPEKSRLMAEAAARKISMIEFLDSVPKGEVYSVLQQADAFLMLLKKSPVFRWGISPNKLFDYFAMAKPVIFGVDTPHDPVKIAEAGISIPSGDSKALAGAICDLFHTPENKRLEMGERGKKYVSAHHNIIQLTDDMEKMLEEAVFGCMPAKAGINA